MTRAQIVSSLFVALLAAGCATSTSPTLASASASASASPPAMRCAAGEQAFVGDLLYFGTTTPGGIVSADDWADFLRTSVTPRFPQGLSVWPAAGQWLGKDGKIARESSFVLNVVHADDAAAEHAIQAIRQDYETRFAQEAVLRVKSAACVSF